LTELTKSSLALKITKSIFETFSAKLNDLLKKSVPSKNKENRYYAHFGSHLTALKFIFFTNGYFIFSDYTDWGGNGDYFPPMNEEGIGIYIEEIGGFQIRYIFQDGIEKEMYVEKRWFWDEVIWRREVPNTDYKERIVFSRIK